MADRESLDIKLKKLISIQELPEIKSQLEKLKIKIEKSDSLLGSNLLTHFSSKNDFRKFLIDEINQILETRTLERTHYYLQRLIKSITETDNNFVNDLNMNLWKQYKDLLTDSIWIFDKRDTSGAHNAGYWGNFIPQIPNQLLRRFTKKGDWVLDPFLGSGTTLIECKRLGRNSIGIELLPEVIKMAKENLAKEESLFDSNIRSEIICADSTKYNFGSELNKLKIKSVQFILLHPPYWDILKFSNDEKDLSNSKNLDGFLKSFGNIIDNTYNLLDNKRYLALVIGDKYKGGEWVPLGFFSMQEVLKRKYKLKSIIVKNFDETKGKMNQKELWRYRAFKGGFYIFKHEYIFLFQKL